MPPPLPSFRPALDLSWLFAWVLLGSVLIWTVCYPVDLPVCPYPALVCPGSSCLPSTSGPLPGMNCPLSPGEIRELTSGNFRMSLVLV